jgi:hypothetical protein
LRHFFRFVLPVLALCLIWPGLALGQLGVLERLVMPGEVIEGHAKLQNECKNCHEPFSKQTQSRLCADCHKEVKADIDRNVGFHGRRPDVRQVECKHCHTDHKGRKADIVRLDTDTFNHDRFADFPLRGAHAKVACSSCHAQGKKHREAPGQCIDCHRKDDKHRGTLGTACADCHNETSWRGAKFDHSKTKFPLLGAHEKVTCATCHPNERYKGTPLLCSDCHRLQDVHAGRYGQKCETCHNPSGWKRISFNHERDTKFALTGRHRVITCDTCHKGRIYEDKQKMECVACHTKDDVHKTRNGPKCESCHSTEGWRTVKFDHNKDTKFALKGKHEKARCESCHRGNVQTEKPQTSCISCHRADDVHKGQLGTNCARCHNEGGWRSKVFFDHDLTRFPLIGLHASVACEACHLASTFRGTSSNCADCHKDPEHKGRLGPNCAQCHNPNGWTLWRFDHNTQTKFKLTGSHIRAECHDCHNRPVQTKISLSMACVECHRKDDIHRGGFGSACERCHVTESFNRVQFGR